MAELLHKQLTDRILHAAIAVHRALGPGLLESAYELCLFDKLQRDGVSVARQVEMPIEFEGRTIDCGYRIDLLVEKAVIIEVKSVDDLAPIHSAQLLTYMRLAKIDVGLLMNFNSRRLKDGLVRMALSSHNSISALSAASAVNVESKETSE
jgi:GxxExxY protein